MFKKLSLFRKEKNIFNLKKTELLLVIYDVLAAAFSYPVALWLRFDFRFLEIPEYFFNSCIKFLPVHIIATIIVFSCFRLYKRIWRFASFIELEKTIFASIFLGVLHTVLITIFIRRMPISYYIIGMAIQFALTVLIRFSYRFILLERSRRITDGTHGRVMLIGAGSAGQMILRDIHSAKVVTEQVCCIIDDNKDKWDRSIDGVPVVGGREDILLNVEKYEINKIYLAIPSLSAENRRDILEICKETNCELKILSSVYENVTVKSMKEVAVEDLLGRETVKVDMGEIFDFISNKVILVTGGGGSIGSELCRQIAMHSPKQLIVFDVYENNAHAIGLELKDKYPNLNLEVLIGSVRDSRRINQVFEKYKPEIVYHAAAHKHVPLMEDSPCESIKNNAIGTYKTAYAAMMNDCKRFVLISTDKAVNPTNIMGASKRICEMIIQSFAKKIAEGEAYKLLPLRLHTETENTEDDVICVRNVENPKTEFVAVRFGNVLGSNGSVIPRFKEQIAKGGPVTVTHPEIIRYFMTIPEASSLVLQAGTYAEGGEIFVLDMGAPVKIDTLARNLIKLSGLKPDVDIKISYTGLRPGEKLYEEKLMSEEGLKTTPNELIHIGAPIPFDENDFLNKLHILMEAAYSDNEDDIRNIVSKIVPTYRSADVHGSIPNNKVFSSQMKEIEQKDIVEKELLTKNG